MNIMEFVWQGHTEIGSIALDASVDEAHTMTATATSHPVETGSNITDHVHQDPRMIRIEGFITNHPIQKPPSQAEGVREVQKEFTWKADPDIPLVQVGGPGIIGGVTGAIASAVGADLHSATATGFEPLFDRVQDVYEEMEAIYNESRVIDIVTSLKVYFNMVIESLEVVRDAARGNSLPFTVTARQVAIVETGVVPAPAEPTVQRGKAESNEGKQSSSELGDADPASETAESLLNSMVF